MKKYAVKVSSIFSNILEVEAENEDQAREKARELLENKASGSDKIDMRHYYESTFPPENWPVITEERYKELKEHVKETLDNDFEIDENRVAN